MSKKKSNNFSISKSLEEIENINQYLQSEEVDIDKALEEFKKGIKLSQEIKKHLQQAENKVNKLSADLDKTIDKI